jgi:hypothetical protein
MRIFCHSGEFSGGAKRLPVGMGIGGSDFQKGICGSAGAAGVLPPFVQGVPTSDDEDAIVINPTRRLGMGVGAAADFTGDSH